MATVNHVLPQCYTVTVFTGGFHLARGSVFLKPVHRVSLRGRERGANPVFRQLRGGVAPGIWPFCSLGRGGGSKPTHDPGKQGVPASKKRYPRDHGTSSSWWKLKVDVTRVKALQNTDQIGPTQKRNNNIQGSAPGSVEQTFRK